MAQNTSTPSAGFDPALVAALGASAAALEAGAQSFANAASNIAGHHGVSMRSVTRPFKVESLPNGLPEGYDASQVGALRTAATVFVRTYGVAYLLRKGAAGAYPDARAPDVDICSHLVGGLLELSTKATNWASKLCLLASPGDILDALEDTVRHRVPGDIERFTEDLRKLRVGPQVPNSNVLFDKYTRKIQAIKNAQALQHSPVPLEEAAVLALQRRDDHEYVRLYLKALQQEPCYAVQAADMLAGEKFKAGTLTLEDASQRVSMVEVQASTAAEGQAFAQAFAAEAAELARFCREWQRERAQEGQQGGHRNGDGGGLCYNCGVASHHVRQCKDPNTMNRHALIASLRERGVQKLPGHLRQFDPPPLGCQCSFCSSKPAAHAADRRAYVVDVFPAADLEGKAAVYSAKADGETQGQHIATFDCAASVSIADSKAILVPGSIKPLPVPIRIRWGGGRFMEATATGAMLVQGLRVPDVYLVDGFGRNLVSTVALRMQYAFQQHVDELKVYKLQSPGGAIGELVAVGKYLAGHMYSIPVIIPLPFK
eukprot:CAMPEP_0194677410 /NCGR_PEP_ID=MMETSP0295-20121207/9481_1 /TAXON_ID=39354 /ORGANISM="Heterosigma akashiwo, Strain CCMP2393" /LENGTH=542 /DNA_ID=CAMNT_0039562219 /DNA_START=403 /DNA_END=2029 /DNA_ORIENTATION=-